MVCARVQKWPGICPQNAKKRFFAPKTIFELKITFWAKSWEMIEKVRKGWNRAPKHQEKHWLQWGWRDGDEIDASKNSKNDCGRFWNQNSWFSLGKIISGRSVFSVKNCSSVKKRQPEYFHPAAWNQQKCGKVETRFPSFRAEAQYPL